MLRLLALLQTHRYWAGAELADRLAVSARTLRRDVERLRELGYPVRASRGVAGGYQLKAGAAVPPLLLDDDEAVAIIVGLRAAVTGSVAGIEEASVRALAKVIQVIPRRLRHRADALGAYTVPVAVAGPPVDAALLTALALAARADEQARFDYTDREGKASRRRVEPHRLVSLGGRWYLVGFDVDRDDWRTFRLDRIAGPLTTGPRFRPRELPGGDAAAFVRAAVRTGPSRESHQVEVLVDAPVEAVARVVGRWGTAEPAGDPGPAGDVGPAGDAGSGRCRLRMAADDLAWPALVLTRVGAPFTVVGPPAFAEHVRAVGRLFAAASRSAASLSTASLSSASPPTASPSTASRPSPAEVSGPAGGSRP
ncbi:helix-turn-helix transcriptional regulator [Pseudofrankia inefficax]|nr:WYL domain-containing protein [Pseudofrankia inefficax]